MQETLETRVRSLGQEVPLEEGMATQSSILPWRIPWTEEPDGLESKGPQGVRHDRSDLARVQYLMCLYLFSFKVFIEFAAVLFLFYVGFFGQEACGILAPWPEIEPTPPAFEGEVLTTGPPGKSPLLYF